MSIAALELVDHIDGDDKVRVRDADDAVRLQLKLGARREYDMGVFLDKQAALDLARWLIVWAHQA